MSLSRRIAEQLVSDSKTQQKETQCIKYNCLLGILAAVPHRHPPGLKSLRQPPMAGTQALFMYRRLVSRRPSFAELSMCFAKRVPLPG